MEGRLCRSFTEDYKQQAVDPGGVESNEERSILLSRISTTRPRLFSIRDIKRSH